jgi:hypothetical protein
MPPTPPYPTKSSCIENLIPSASSGVLGKWFDRESPAFTNGLTQQWIRNLNRLLGGCETMESGTWLEVGHWSLLLKGMYYPGPFLWLCFLAAMR